MNDARPLLAEWLAVEPHNAEAARLLKAVDNAGNAPAGDRQLRFDTASPDALAPPASVDLRQTPSKSRTPWT